MLATIRSLLWFVKTLNKNLTPKQTVDEPAATAQDPLLEDALLEDAPAPPMFGCDTSLKEINEAIRRAEFRSLQSDSLLKKSTMRQEVVQGYVWLPH